MFLSITSIYTSENKSFDMKFVYNLTKPYIFVVYLLNIWSVFCKLLDTSYSKPGDIKLTGLALVKFDLQGVSLVHCGSLCSEDECCKEVLYNATSGRCIGSPFSDFKSTVNSLVEASYDGMSKYQKGCESGWLEFKGHCFLHVLGLVSWYDAKLVCKKKCSYLVEINSLEESNWLASTFLDKVTCGADEFFSCTSWIGGNDMNVEGSYVWDHSNTSLVYTNWHPQEPSLLHPSDASTRDCIDLLRSGRWNDRPCLYSNTFICEKKFGD